ncbi:MAG: hypothetical protein SWQ30_20550 [Thermodesulfobacteriota bacterium]|nr:hypothetical protein [Thermodesulfobacteriota bacterium]
MKNLRLCSIFLATLTITALSNRPAYAQYHHVDDCTVCHYGGLDPADCTASPNLALVRDVIDTPCSDLRQAVFGPFVSEVPPYNGVCQVCHESIGQCSTKYYRNDGSGDDHPVYKPGLMGPTDCNVCHKHVPYEFGHQGSVGTGCDETGCHDGSSGPHGTHVSSNNKGPETPMACGDCHDTNNYPLFGADNAQATLAATNVCDPCHSPGGAYNGIGHPDSGPIYSAKASWHWVDSNSVKQEGVYDEIPHWQAESAYETNGIVRYDGNAYQSLSDFTSGVSFNGSNWSLIGPLHTSWYGQWHSGTVYKLNDVVTYYGKAYKCIAAEEFTSGAVPTVSKWELILSGETLASTKEKWCAGCHDRQAGLYCSDSMIPPPPAAGGVRAPSVIGDDSTFGFYATGHGKPGIEVECEDCHDLSSNHIDGDQRTYHSSLDNYQAGYRLKADMKIPRSWVDIGDDPFTHPSSEHNAFGLCMEQCHVSHNAHATVGSFQFIEEEQQVGLVFTPPYLALTHFRSLDALRPLESLHEVHVQSEGQGGLEWDSDWDDVRDSTPSCPTCHNVHGSPSPAMVRHGELMSTPCTVDKTPAFDFKWLKLVPPIGKGEETLVLSDGLYGGSHWGQMILGQYPDNRVCGGSSCHLAAPMSDYRRFPGGRPSIMEFAVWTSDPAGIPKVEFYQGDEIRYNLRYRVAGFIDVDQWFCSNDEALLGGYPSGGHTTRDPIWKHFTPISGWVPRGVNEAYEDFTLPLNASPGEAYFYMDFGMFSDGPTSPLVTDIPPGKGRWTTTGYGTPFVILPLP